AAIFSMMPDFRTYNRLGYNWPHVGAGLPFAAGSGEEPILGTNPAALRLSDGVTSWGGPGGWADTASLIAADRSGRPFHCIALGRQDNYAGFERWGDYVLAVNALEGGRHGYACAWDNEGHTGENGISNLYGEGFGPAWATYNDLTFALNESYPAFSA